MRAVDKKPLPHWYQVVEDVVSLCLDLSEEKICHKNRRECIRSLQFCCGYGGMGIIERYRVECLRSILINTHMLEASYNAGVPIISTQIRTLPELVDHGVNGLLVPVGDSEALADAIEQLARDSDLRKQMGKANFK